MDIDELEAFDFGEDQDSDILEDDLGGTLLSADILELKRAYLAEKFSPTLLPHQTTLLVSVQKILQKQNKILQSISKTMNPLGRLTSNLLEMEMERIKYFIQEYLRLRLFKIDKFSSLFATDTPLKLRLSDSELKYASGFFNIINKLFFNSFLNKLPQDMQDIVGIDEFSGMTMEVHPKLDQYVFIRVLVDISNYVLPFSEARLDFKRGDIVFIQYSHLGDLVETKRVEFI